MVSRHLFVLLILLLLVACQLPVTSTPPPETSVSSTSASTTTVSPASSLAATGLQLTQVRVGFLKVLGEAPMILARERGYFSEEGINVELVDFAVTADALPQLGTGQIDVITGGLNPAVFNAVARGVGVKIVADGGSLGPNNDYLALVIRRDLIDSGRYRGPADLRGR